MKEQLSQIRQEDGDIRELRVDGEQPSGRRRFTCAVASGTTVAIAPLLWLLFFQWSPAPGIFRTAYADGYTSNFYDLQARSILHGHLWIAPGKLGWEAFVHGGRQYTYFGLWASLIRMPVLVVTRSFDGKLSALSMLLAWAMLAVFTSLTLWRTRVMLRGDGPLDILEAWSFGVLTAVLLGGSVIEYLAASPFVFNEDLMWSLSFTVGSIYALLGVLESPCWSRVWLVFASVLGVNLNNLPMAYACVLSGIGCSVWFWMGKGGDGQRRWALPLLAAVMIPFAVGCAINWAKFGILVGIPVSDQISFRVFGLEHINGGKYLSLKYLPGDLTAYFRLDGLRFGGSFPYVTLPAGPATQIGARFDETSRTASVTSSMFLLFVLTLWGGIASLRRGAGEGLRKARLVLIAIVLPIGSILIYGWILNRFLAEFLPLLLLGSTVGMVELWRWLHDRRALARRLTFALITALGIFGMLANFGIATSPTWSWSGPQLAAFLRTQDAMGGYGPILHGESLPGYAPANVLFVRGDCKAVFYSDGEVPIRADQAENWIFVEKGVDNRLCRSLLSGS